LKQSKRIGRAAREPGAACRGARSRDAEERAKLSRHNDVAEVMDYCAMLSHLHALPRRRTDLPDHNATERALRGIALGA
jgi:hypothetical protein